VDLFIPGLRDRRAAAADETHAPPANGGRPRDIFGRGTAARRRVGVVGRPFDVRSVTTDRGVDSITTIVLHQMAVTHDAPLPDFSTDTDITSRHTLDRVIAHFIVRTDGALVYTHDIEHILNDGGGRRGIDIEFEGHYGNDRTPSDPRLSEAAIRAGRRLLLWLDGFLPSLSHIHPHGQIQSGSSSKLHSCCGPDVWMNVGEWAVSNLSWECNQPVSSYANHGISERQRNAAYDQGIE
jgi:hypothetical protein